jgi:DNA-binding PadR family transcriptional regulator
MRIRKARISREASVAPRAADTLNRIEFLVLTVLFEEPRHGYGIAGEIGRRTGGEVTVRPGSLYRVLDRLGRRGLIEPTDEAPTEGDDRRSYYAITAEGRAAVEVEARLLASLARDVLAAGEGRA